MYLRTKLSLYTKLQSLLNSEVFYHLVNGSSTVQLDRVVEQGKIVVFNLSKGQMGSECSQVYGKMIIAMLTSIAQRRAKMPPHLSKPIYLVLDEAENVYTKSLSTILQETRKYGLHLVLSTQNIPSGQENSKLRRNLMSNTAIKVIGTNGIPNLEPLGKECGIPLKDLQRLKKYQFLVHIRGKSHKRGLEIWSKLILGRGLKRKTS